MKTPLSRIRSSFAFIRKGLLCAFLSILSGTVLAETAVPRGGRVGWARIITPNTYWNRHAETDPHLTTFIRNQTSLNIDPTWYAADPGSLDQLCRYPLLFTNNLTDVTDESQLKNIAEYIRRGGFVFVDACSNHYVTPSPDRFLEKHLALMKKLCPGSEIHELPASHEVYRQYFVVKQTPPHIFYGGVYDRAWARHGLYGVFENGRMISLLSLSGLQCGWSGVDTSANAQECMKMAVNIYVYAMTR